MEQLMVTRVLALLLLTSCLAAAESGDAGTDAETDAEMGAEMDAEMDAEGDAEVDIPMESWREDNSTCVCKVMTGWSEMKEYHKVQDLRTRVQDAETIINAMNFTAIFERLQNMTDRLNSLEDGINSQAIATSVTELFALRKNVEALVNIMESNSSALVYEQQVRLALELEAITNVTNEIWSRNPYKQRDDYKQEVSDLRARFSRCHKDIDMSPFAGDSLPLNVSMLDGWCPTEKSLRVGFPLTHRWEDNAYDRRGMWFKDPQPLTDTSRTEVWAMMYTTNGDYMLKRFPNYVSLSSSRDSYFRRSMTGIGAVVYNNALYYSYNGKLNKVDLDSQVMTSISIGYQTVNYRSQGYGTYVDLKVDEMGLWMIYSMSSDYKIAISKLDPDTLLTQNTWITDVSKRDVCAAFMICGRMYTIKSCSTRMTSSSLNYVYNTHTSKGSYSQYHVPSVYGTLRELTYNPRERLLFGWDNAHMVTYTVGWAEEDNDVTNAEGDYWGWGV